MPRVAPTPPHTDSPQQPRNMDTQDLFSAVRKGPLDAFVSQMATHGNLNSRDAQGNTPLLLAIRKQRYRHVDYLLEQGADAAVQNNQGNTTLIFAAYTAPVALCEQLFACGALVNARNARGITPLMAAAITGNMEVVRWLLQHGADVAQKDIYGCTACMQAHLHGRMAVVELLAEQGETLHPTSAAVIAQLRENGSLRTATCKHPFFSAVMAADSVRIKAFPRLGMTPSADEAKQLIPLAIEKHHEASLRFLFPCAHAVLTRQDVSRYIRKAIAEDNDFAISLCKHRNLFALLTSEDKKNLIIASIYTHNACMARLVYSYLNEQRDLDELMRLAIEENLPEFVLYIDIDAMHVYNGEIEVLRSLSEEFGLKTPRAKNYMLIAIRLADAPMLACVLDFVGSSAFTQEEKHYFMQQAVCSQSAEVVSLLLARNFFSDLPAPQQQALMRMAIKDDCADVLKALCDDCNTNTAPDALLDAALEFENSLVARFIINHYGIEDHAQQHILGPALINAAHDGNLRKVRCLLDCGADVNFTDKQDRTPFNQVLGRGIFYECINACCYGQWSRQLREHRYILELLLQHGATLHAIEKHAALPAPRMQGMMRKLGLPAHGYEPLITDHALARQILSLLPHTLTWI